VATLDFEQEWAMHRRMRATRGLLPALVGLCLSLPAWATERWLLIPADPQAGVIASRLRQTLAQRSGGEILLLEEVASRLPPPVDPAPPATALAMAAALDGAARRYYHHQDPAKAAADLEKAVTEATALLSRLRERDALWEAIRRARLLLATVAMLATKEDQARLHCREIASRDPAWEPPARDFAPPVRTLYADERQKLEQSRAEIRVPGAAGAIVFVDGVSRGTAPLIVGVPPGSHHVQGLEDAVLSAVQEISVPAEGASVRLEPFCSSPANLSRPRCRTFLREAAGAANLVDLAVSGTLRIGRARGEKPLPEASAALPLRLDPRWLDDLADFLVGKRLLPPALPAAPVAKAGAPFYKRWWFWTLVGVAVAGGLTGFLAVPRPGPTMEMTFTVPR
jgi:hypothetical protein